MHCTVELQGGMRGRHLTETVIAGGVRLGLEFSMIGAHTIELAFESAEESENEKMR